MVLDNSIEEESKLEDWQNALRALLKAAYQSGHHIIVIAQSQTIAEKIGGLNGPEIQSTSGTRSAAQIQVGRRTGT